MKESALELVKKGESNFLEFKESLDRECIETAGAFANTKGGTILIGISDNGRVKGVSTGKESLSGWTNEISQDTEPKIIPEIEAVDVDGKKVVLIHVKEFPIKPVAVKGRCFRRVGNSNRVMTPQEIAEMHFHSIGSSWDAFPSGDMDVGDLDLKKVENYVRMANATGRRKIENEKPLEVLKKLKLLRNGKPTWGSILVFGKESPTLMLLSPVHCGRFKMDKTQIIDDLMVGDDLITQVDETMKFITRHVSVRYEFEGKPRRKEIWEYPLDALREEVINAIVHRDYTFPANVQVEIYDDGIRIWSPGKLPLGITVEELYKKPHDSVLRNKLIAQVFFDIGYIERYGTGTTKIMELCKEHGIPLPEFEEVSGGFSVVFRKDVYTEEYLRGLGLNERQVRGVTYVKEKEKITNREYQEINQVSNKTAYLELSGAVEKGVFAVKGSGKQTRYVLKVMEK